MSERAVTLPDAAWEWLEAYAKDRGQTVDEYLAYVVNYYRADGSAAALRTRVRDLELALEAARPRRQPHPLTPPVSHPPGRPRDFSPEFPDS
jgi:hypothetical protein